METGRTCTQVPRWWSQTRYHLVSILLSSSRLPLLFWIFATVLVEWCIPLPSLCQWLSPVSPLSSPVSRLVFQYSSNIRPSSRWIQLTRVSSAANHFIVLLDRVYSCSHAYVQDVDDFLFGWLWPQLSARQFFFSIHSDFSFSYGLLGLTRFSSLNPNLKLILTWPFYEVTVMSVEFWEFPDSF